MDQQKQNRPEPAVEDLTVGEAGAAEVKGGAQLTGIEGESTDPTAIYDLKLIRSHGPV